MNIESLDTISSVASECHPAIAIANELGTTIRVLIEQVENDLKTLANHPLSAALVFSQVGPLVSLIPTLIHLQAEQLASATDALERIESLDMRSRRLAPAP